jgi:beta-glucanase (GH16 family)
MKDTIRTNSIKAIAVVALFSLVWGCKVEPIQKLPERNFVLVWGDEFNADSGALVDASKWANDLGNGTNGWGNNELQSYTNNPKNISHDGNGNLVITAIKEAGGGYTSARVKTQGLFAQEYGRMEARIKTPTGTGIWPAFWMLGSNIDEVKWPQCGEIDIMEQRGQQSSITYSTLHGPGYSGAQALSTPYALRNARFDTDFHLYAVEWNEEHIDFFVDDYLFKRIVPTNAPGEWVYNQPFFLILNVAVGGNFLGYPDANTDFPESMYVDYVRVYKEK